MSKKISVRTDLAIEIREMHNTSEIDGVKIVTQDFKNIRVTCVKIENAQGQKNLGKPIGNYITIESPTLHKNNVEYRRQIINILADNIKKLLAHKKFDSVLIIGLGNWNITPDSLGPKVISKVLVTRHIKNFIPDELKNSVCCVSAISPGVLGITGIETFEIVKGICERVKPDLVFVIDSLAARNASRINSTIQLSDTGITPGAGMGNKRVSLDKESLGCEVISIGVPTVIDAATLVNDTMDKILDAMSDACKKNFEHEFFVTLSNLNSDEKYDLITQILNPYEENMFVTPKEVDEVIERLSNIIANAINISLHNKIKTSDIDKFICK